jgi:hypothetical protein
VNNILSPFSAELTEEQRLYGVFQLGSATAHTAYVSMVFGDRIISRGLWPPRFPDVVPRDNYLWGSLKDKMHQETQTNTMIRGQISPTATAAEMRQVAA